MPHIDHRMKPAATALVLVLAILALAACGGSSTSNTGASASTATTGGGRGGRFAAVRECLQKNGITLPKRTPDQTRPGLGGLLGGGAGPTLPKGVTRAQYEAALKKCGASTFRGFRGGGARFNSPVFKQALSKFAACMRENGVSLPAPNTSGNGPIFNSKALNTSSAQFRGAQAKCRPILSAARGQRGQGFGGPTARSSGAGPPAAG
jgi:hypothetical protein